MLTSKIPSGASEQKTGRLLGTLTIIKVRRKLSWKSSIIPSRTEQPFPLAPLHACGEISCTQFSTALVFGLTAPLNPPWEDLSLCLNVLGSHVFFTYPSSTLGSWVVWLVLLSWKQYCSSLLRQLVFHALVCGSVVSAPKECLPSGSGIHTSKVNFYC